VNDSTRHYAAFLDFPRNRASWTMENHWKLPAWIIFPEEKKIRINFKLVLCSW